MDFQINNNINIRRVSRLFDPNEFRDIHSMDDNDIEEELNYLYHLANESNYIQSKIKQSSIQNITVIHNEKHVDGEFECPICYDTCDKNNHVLTNCNHEFCNNCISTIIHHANRDAKDASCPLCRQECSLIETASCEVFERISNVINKCYTVDNGEDDYIDDYFDIAHVFDEYDYMISPTSVARALSPEFDSVSLSPPSPNVENFTFIRYTDDDLDLAAILMEFHSIHRDMDLE